MANNTPEKPTSYDVGNMLNGMEQRFKEGLIMVSQLKLFTEEGDDKAVGIITDLLGLDSEVYIKSAQEQGLWGTKSKEEK